MLLLVVMLLVVVLLLRVHHHGVGAEWRIAGGGVGLVGRRARAQNAGVRSPPHLVLLLILLGAGGKSCPWIEHPRIVAVATASTATPAPTTPTVPTMARVVVGPGLVGR